MHIVATLLVRDEEDIVAQNIEHHIKQGITQFIITDNNSKDKTLEIIKKFKEVVHIINEPDEAYNQSVWVTRMAKIACDYNPDWIVHLDADEFWSGFEVLESVPDKIDLVKSADHLNPAKSSGVTCKEFLPLLSYDKLFDFNEEKFLYFKPSKHRRLKGCKIVHRPSRKIIINQGNHDAANINFQAYSTNITIDHYPIRSFEHFERKVKNGGESYAKSKIDYQIGIHWREWYKLYLKGQLHNEYRKLALNPDNVALLLKEKKLYSRHENEYNFKKYNSWLKKIF